MTEHLGYTQNAVYMSAPRLRAGCAAPTFLPSISIMQSSYKPYDNYPAPGSLRRYLTAMPWKPSTYYGSNKADPCIPNTSCMPDPMSDRNRLIELDSIKVPPIFAASRNALYTRYTINDWKSSNQSNYKASDRVRGGSELLRLEANRLSHETDEKTKMAQEDVGKKLGDRLNDISFWKMELDRETDAMICEITSLSHMKTTLEKTLAELEVPLRIAQECLFHREKRHDIDLTHDNVERELIKEVDTIKHYQELLRNLVAACANQLALNRSAQHEMEKDSADKFTAFSLDTANHQLRNTSRGIAYHDGIERLDNTISVPETWLRFTNGNIQRSQSERTASLNLRSLSKQTLDSCAEALVKQWNTVNNAFTERIREYTEAKHKLQNHLARVLQEIFDQEKNIELLKKAIMDKEAPMMVAQTRLATRAHRPHMEACRDPVQHRLVEEVYEINESVDQLKAELRKAENALQHLLRTKSALEHDLQIKTNSLFIDREKCMGLRQTYPMSPRIATY